MLVGRSIIITMKRALNGNSLKQAHSRGALRAQVLAVGGIVGVTAIAGMALLAQGAFAVAPVDNSAADNITIEVPSSCTFGGVVDVAHTTTIISGQKAENVGTTTMTAYCNDQNGFRIYAVGAGDGIEGNTKMISSLGQDYDIETGTTLSGNTSAWGMKLTATSPATYPITIATGFDSLHVVPSTYTTVAYRESVNGSYAGTDVPGSDGSTDGVNGASFEATYSIYASGQQQAGTYIGQVRYAMMHPYSNTSLVSLAKAFENANVAPIEKTVGGRTYSYYPMQSMTPAICDAVNIIGEASQVQLIDTRDQKLYWATKLEDGNCWMTQSLDLDLSSTVGLTSADSDISATTCTGTTCNTAPYTAAAGYTSDGTTVTWTPSNTTVTSLTAANFPNDSAAYNEPHSYNPGDYYQKGTYFGSSTCDYRTGNCANFSSTPFSGNGTHGHVGNYYNWTAAVASNDTSGVASGTMTNSVCPKGWKLPKNGDYGVLNKLYNQNHTGSGLTNGDYGLLSAPLYFVRAGYVDGGSLYIPGYGGRYWSGTLGSSAYAYYLYFDSSSVDPAYNDSRYYGFSLRCVARSE